MEINVSLSTSQLAKAISSQDTVEVKDLVKQLLEDLQDDHVTWLIILECLELLRNMYSEEADWYTSRELNQTFQNPDCAPSSHYAAIRVETLAYQLATEHVLDHVRNVLEGKLDQ